MDHRVTRFAIVALLVGVLAGCVHPTTKEPVVIPSSPEALAVVPAFHEGTQARHERFNATSREGAARLVFLGDSITEGWETAGKDVWDRYYAHRRAANFGIGGDRTEHVLWRLDHGNLDGLSPRLIVVMIGTNNAGHRQDQAGDTAAGVRAIVERLRAKCPRSRILLLAIFPRGQTLDDPCRRLNDETNMMLRGFADATEAVEFLDIGGRFVDQDLVPRADLMPDRLHLSRGGYELWAEAIEARVRRALGE